MSNDRSIGVIRVLLCLFFGVVTVFSIVMCTLLWLTSGSDFGSIAVDVAGTAFVVTVLVVSWMFIYQTLD